MGKYVFAYSGGGMAATEEERNAAMAAWGGWFGQLGAAVVDPGNPFGVSANVGANGGGTGLSGYSVVSAGSLDAATELARGCPVLANGGSVDVYETLEIM
jgi:hypothetical protein